MIGRTNGEEEEECTGWVDLCVLRAVLGPGAGNGKGQVGDLTPMPAISLVPMGKMPENQVAPRSETSLGTLVNDPSLSFSKPHPKSTETWNLFVETSRQSDDFS